MVNRDIVIPTKTKMILLIAAVATRATFIWHRIRPTKNACG
jgi:hypothetical protein